MKSFIVGLIDNIKSDRNFWAILCLILLTGTALRICGLTRQSIWLDEANGIRIAEKSFPRIISELKRDVSPPLHYFLLHIWIKVFGPGELSTRTFASIFGILFIPAIYYVGKSLFDRRTGLIAAFIVSIAHFHIRYSQEVRMYSMLALFGLLSMYYLYTAVKTDDRASWRRYTLFTILTVYTHNYGIFVAISGVIFFAICLWESGDLLASWASRPAKQKGRLFYKVRDFAFHAMKHNSRLRGFLISLCVMAAAYVPWLPIFIMGQFGSPAIIGWLPHMRPYHIYETFKVYSGLDFWIFRPVINSLIMWIGFAVFFFCFLAGIFSIKRNKHIFVPYIQSSMELNWLLCYLFVTLGIPMLVSIVKPIYIPNRYSMSAWPAFPLLLGVGLSKIRSSRKLLTVIGLILLISSISLCYYYFAWVKSYDRDIARFIESKGDRGDLIVFAPSWIDVPINYYLHTPFKHLGYPGYSMGEYPIARRSRRAYRNPYEMAGLARSKLGGSGKVFLVSQESVTWVGDIQAVKRVFDRSFSKIESEKYGDAEVTVYRS